jgi:hypothetical protein
MKTPPTGHKKHFLVLSSAGKPIWSNHGNAEDLPNFMGILQALISVHIDSKDSIKSIVASNYLFVFQTFGPIYLVSISSTGEGEQAVNPSD